MKLSRSMLRGLTPEVIQQALALRSRVVRVERLAARRQKLMLALAAIESEMSRLDAPTRGERAPAVKPRARRRFSAETRAKMRASQKARWEKVRAKEKAETVAAQ